MDFFSRSKMCPRVTSSVLLMSLLSGPTGCRLWRSSDSIKSTAKSQSALQGDGTVCQVETDSSVKDLYDNAQDPFRRKVLTTAGCREVLAQKNPYVIGDFMKSAGCIPESRFLVSEKGVSAMTAETGLDPRSVDQWKCGNSTAGAGDNAQVLDRIWISGPGSAMHIIAWDPKSRSFNFYSADHPTEPNQIFYHGNSHIQATSINKTFRHPCTNCHIGGGLLMKELHFPWPFWHSDASNLPSVNSKSWSRAQSPILAVKAAEAFEISTIASITSANQTYVEGLISGMKFGSPLPQSPRGPAKYADVLYPLFCERGIELMSSPSKTSAIVPWGLVINRLLVPRNGRISLVSGLDSQRPRNTSRLDTQGFADKEDWIGLGSNRGFVATFASQTAWSAAFDKFFTKPSDGLGTQMLFPARHFADDDLVSRLVAAGIVPEDFAVNVLLTDLQNPIFSPTRCGLLEKIPADSVLPNNPSEARVQGEKIVAAFEVAVNADPNKSNPGSGAAKYLAMKALTDKTAFVNAFAGNCEAKLSDPVSVAGAMALRWKGFRKPQNGIGQVYIGSDFNRGIEDFVEKAAVPMLKAGVQLTGITQGCEVK